MHPHPSFGSRSFGARAVSGRVEITARSPAGRPLLAKQGADATIAILKSYHDKEPGSPVFQSNFGFELVYELLENRQTQEAVAFYKMYLSFGQDLVKRFISSGDSYLRHGTRIRAGQYFEMPVRSIHRTARPPIG